MFKKYKYLYLALILALFSYNEAHANMEFWDIQKKGTNFFNNIESENRYRVAKDEKIKFVRLSPNKWVGLQKRDKGNFLIGDTQNQSGIPNQDDIIYLKTVLNMAQRQNIKILLTMVSLPNYRWSQHNNGVQQRDLFESFEAQSASIEFWTKVAYELKGHPAIAGFNILNEPSPELTSSGVRFEDWMTQDYLAWYEKIKNTPQDLNLYYAKVIEAIRTVDKDVPIVIESGFYATPWAFKILQAQNDPNILYSFHMYEPFSYTNHRNKNNFKYPGNIPSGEKKIEEIQWDAQYLKTFFQPIKDFQNKYNIPNNRIIVSEFGAYRKKPDVDKYFHDLITYFDQEQWHWAFYSFREDAWDGMDYELGSENVSWQYWNDIETNKTPQGDYNSNKNNPIWQVIQKSLQKE